MDFSKMIIGVMRWGIWGANHSESGVQNLIETSLKEGLFTFDHLSSRKCLAGSTAVKFHKTQ